MSKVAGKKYISAEIKDIELIMSHGEWVVCVKVQKESWKRGTIGYEYFETKEEAKKYVLELELILANQFILKEMQAMSFPKYKIIFETL